MAVQGGGHSPANLVRVPRLRPSHYAVSIMVKSEDGKVERAREGRAVIGESRKLTIAGGDRDGWRFKGPPWDDGSYKAYQVPIDGGC